MPVLRKSLAILGLAALLGACLGEDGFDPQAGLAETGPAGAGERPADPDRFLLFLDRQQALAAGDYRIVVGTVTPGVSGEFSLSIDSSDGGRRQQRGRWSNSGGRDPDSADNPVFALTLERPGGIELGISSSADTYLYLLDAAGNIIVESGGDTPNPTIELAASAIDSAAYANAYYAAVDPDGRRTTLADWQLANGFDQGVDAEVLFRDVKDLGYGRWMFMRRLDDGGIAFYVHNFQVTAIPGRGYSRLNLDAAVNNNRNWHIGTNAIEFRPDANGRFYARFFTFEPADANGVQVRAISADLDGRGEKFMPQLCITCHGGVRLPLLEHGVFPDGGYIDANLHALEPDSFEFADAPGRTRAEQEAAIKFINQAIYASFPTPDNAIAGSHDGVFLRELMEGWYGGVDANGQLRNDRFDADFVPAGWRPDPVDGVPPAGADALYLTVVAPSCIVCHARRGSNLQSDINFSSYEKFIAYSERIQELVYDRGLMPAAFLHYQDFWDPAGIKAQLLGSFLSGFDRGRDDGSTLQPGRPIANPGPDRIARSPVPLSAAASRFAQRYNWRIAARPVGAEAAVLEDTERALARLVTAVEGTYTLELVVSNNAGASSPASVQITVDADAIQYGFETDIKPALQANCTECHAPAGVRGRDDVEGIPVFYVDGEFLYQNVRRRVDLEDPENSLLLLKPSGNHHFGELRPGFNPTDPNDRELYDRFLHWIVQGAPP